MEEMAKRESGEAAASARALAELPEKHATAEADFDDPDLYINRELSLLAFQHRVLEEAEDERRRGQHQVGVERVARLGPFPPGSGGTCSPLPGAPGQTGSDPEVAA